MTMKIQIANTDSDLLACFPVMRELRPHVERGEFLSSIRNQERAGYRLAFAQAQDEPVTVAGFRISENLAWGRFLYVDDLVTCEHHRSKGYGTQMLAWLRVQAAQEGCNQLHLDSGSQRKDAHRFYLREGMQKFGFHFAERIMP